MVENAVNVSMKHAASVSLNRRLFIFILVLIDIVLYTIILPLLMCYVNNNNNEVTIIKEFKKERRRAFVLRCYLFIKIVRFAFFVKNLL